NDLKQKGLPWEKAKAWDNSAVLGDWKPVSDFPNLKDINFGFYKNNELVQQGNSGNMIYSFNTLLVNISKYFSLNIGDVI
ncbi:fumarylacetoacetate hydrolase family protein, partial [Acinetobacter baumannii]